MIPIEIYGYVTPIPINWNTEIPTSTIITHSFLEFTNTVLGRDAECTFADRQDAEPKMPKGHKAERT